MSYITVAAATLTSVPLDFAGNRDRVLESIRMAKAQGARIRTGPELELSGYGCMDHFKEPDTIVHCWEILADIITDPVCKDMIIDVGLPIRHRNVTYNARVLCTYRHVYCIRPKMLLANDLIYRELRWFSPWPASKQRTTETYYLEETIRRVTDQWTCPIGDCILSTVDTAIGCETCEELFTPLNPSSYYGLNGCEVILNSSASHAQLRKLSERISLIANCTRKLGGIYIYSNAVGVDGEARHMFDGASLCISNGRIIAQGEQFSMKDVEVTVATVDLEEVRTFRNSSSRSMQAVLEKDFPRVECDMKLSRPADEIYLSDSLSPSQTMDAILLDPMQEIWLAEALYLWNYLVRSRSGGFFIALSGGLDSCTTSLFVYGMAIRLLKEIEKGEKILLTQLRQVVGEQSFTPRKPQDIVNRLLHTTYMGTVNSSEETRSRARQLAAKIGSYHTDLNIDAVVKAHEQLVESGLKIKTKFVSEGGTKSESLAKENVQARSRMVISYHYAQLSTIARNLPTAGKALLVLSSANVDEQLRGYVTKYDCGFADIAPLGSISKVDARRFCQWAQKEWSLPILNDFLTATPTAELKPGLAQADEDEDEMGFTYNELSIFGKLRKEECLGPYFTYLRLLTMWKEEHPPRTIAEKCMRFFTLYQINRHKATVMTPAIHMSGYSVDDNRFDLRPFLVPTWGYQFKKITDHVQRLEQKLKSKDDDTQAKKGEEEEVD